MKEENQLTKTWNKKYLVIKTTFIAVLVGVPSSSLNMLNTTGNNAGGEVPEMIPTTTIIDNLQ